MPDSVRVAEAESLLQQCYLLLRKASDSPDVAIRRAATSLSSKIERYLQAVPVA